MSGGRVEILGNSVSVTGCVDISITLGVDSLVAEVTGRRGIKVDLISAVTALESAVE